MRRRAVWAIAAIVSAAAIAAAHLSAQGPTPRGRNRRVWTGTIDDREIGLGLTDETPARRPVRYFKDVDVSFRFVSEDDPNRPGFTRWTSRRLTWRGFATSSSAITGNDCVGSGSIDLGPSPSYSATTSAQDAQMKIPCKSWDKVTNWAIILLPHPTVHMPRIDTSMTNCESRRWTVGGVRYTLAVAGGDAEAAFVVENPEDAPKPGQRYRIRAKSNVAGRWKFTVDSSHFRGYATNADVDTAYFELFALPQLRGKYGTYDPDLVFDPAEVEYERTEWKPPSRDSGADKWSVLESRDDTSLTRVEAALTAMDFGAYGELRAYFAPTCGGQWMPATVENTDAWTVKIPDDIDHNSMADSCPGSTGDDCAWYRTLDRMADGDYQPDSADGRGDGLTAFEEYRGFMTQVGDNCDSALAIKHVRTNPTTKDLFIHSPDPLLTIESRRFTHRSELDVWTVCPKYYQSNESRAVNFTMWYAPAGGLEGERLSYILQHGLYVVNEDLPGLYGRTIGFGPPYFVDKVIIDVRAIESMVFDDPRLFEVLPYIKRTLAHELGHALGIRHHGDGNINRPIVLLNQPRCPRGTTEGTVEGTTGPACKTESIAVRGAQNSGDARCPMKYIRWAWYVPPGNPLRSVGTVDFKPKDAHSWSRPQELPGYIGRIMRYEIALDKPGLVGFCTNADGTGINDLPAERNHAGDASAYTDDYNRQRGGGNCKAQLRIKDPE
ncbi:MAG TPA: hypothetical protein VH740_18005 [Vicinamibacterales bacterium]|jgi:hypothetical protein